MRSKFPVLAVMLIAASLTSCDRDKGEATADAKASVAAAPTKPSALSIDTQGFKANIEIPGIEFNGDKMDLDGIKLPKGSVIKGMKIKAVEKAGRDHGSVVFDFSSPVTPDALAQHLVDQAADSKWGDFSRSKALDGALVLRAVKNDDGMESIEYRLAADGTAATRGTATIVSNDAQTVAEEAADASSR